MLAESANQLYRDTSYDDLISFEEDVARIAAVVLVIAESPGSLAEMGAFSSNDTIRKNLRIIVQEKYSSDESFIRYGPVQRIKRDGDGFVGVFPWRSHKNGELVVSSIREHYVDVADFVKGHLDKSSRTHVINESEHHKLFTIIAWIVYLSLAISTQRLYDAVRSLLPNVTQTDIKNKLYCLRLIGWIDVISYSSKDYFYTKIDIDPIDDYAFHSGVKETDSTRRKLDISREFLDAENPPRHVRKVATNARRSK